MKIVACALASAVAIAHAAEPAWYKVQDAKVMADGWHSIYGGTMSGAMGYINNQPFKPQDEPYGVAFELAEYHGRSSMAANMQDRIDRYLHYTPHDKVDEHKLYQLERGRDVLANQALTNVAAMATNERFPQEGSAAGVFWLMNRMHAQARAVDQLDQLYNADELNHRNIHWKEQEVDQWGDYVLSQIAFLAGEPDLGKIALVTAAAKSGDIARDKAYYADEAFYDNPSYDTSYKAWKANKAVSVNDSLMLARLAGYIGKDFPLYWPGWNYGMYTSNHGTYDYQAEKYYKEHGSHWYDDRDDHYYDY